MTNDSYKIMIKDYHFNSHAHVERDYFHFIIIKCYVFISTHTLTWSVTFLTEKNGIRKRISTHTLTWSVTTDNLIAQHIKTISTHTLTWSVTSHFSMVKC